MNDLLRYINLADNYCCDISFEFLNREGHFSIRVKNRITRLGCIKDFKLEGVNNRPNIIDYNVMEMIKTCSTIPVRTN